MAEHEHGCGYEHEHPHGADGDAGCHCSGSGSELVRFSVTAPDDLLRRFDEQIARRGDVANRSEAVRDLIRASIAKEQMRTPDEHVIGSLTMIYDHHTGDLTRRLDEVQHDYTDEIVSTMHVHLDHHNCLEILALKGRGERVYELADRLLGLRGAKNPRKVGPFFVLCIIGLVLGLVGLGMSLAQGTFDLWSLVSVVIVAVCLYLSAQVKKQA